VTIHPFFNGTSPANDTAIVKLKAPFDNAAWANILASENMYEYLSTSYNCGLYAPECFFAGFGAKEEVRRSRNTEKNPHQ